MRKVQENENKVSNLNGNFNRSILKGVTPLEGGR